LNDSEQSAGGQVVIWMWSRALIRRLSNHHECYGTDYDSGAVQHCAAELRVQQVDLNEASVLPFPISPFDAFVISEVCEHLLNPRNALRLAKNHLETGGTLVLTVPNAVPLFARVKLLFGRSVDWLHYPSEATEVTGHVRFYTIESMSRLLQQEGFAISIMRGVSFRMNGLLGSVLLLDSPCLFKRSKSAHDKYGLVDGKIMPGFRRDCSRLCKVVRRNVGCYKEWAC
jgi:SAM-dependent methyltransferase